MTKQTGGPAFPKLSQDERWKTFTSTDGMTLRDYFAAKAMQALCLETLKVSKGDLKLLANNSYTIADEMLKAREQ